LILLIQVCRLNFVLCRLKRLLNFAKRKPSPTISFCLWEHSNPVKTSQCYCVPMPNFRQRSAIPIIWCWVAAKVLGGGKGWLYHEIFATIERLGLSETVHIPGYIPVEELIYWYNAADAFVYPALYEGFGIPVLEALACGKPVLTSNASSLPEAGGKVSVLLPPSDENAWTTALRQTIQNPNPANAPARQEWARTFTWNQTAQQTLNTYRQVLANL
jgi:glycosyltransferase involved in cell wall biosynthesis